MYFFVFILVLLVNAVVGEEVRITNVDEFIQFKDNVNGGANYSGTTVFLESDLDFTGKSFEPIGTYNYWGDSNYFNGTFDGQGHVISNLVMSSSSLESVGLFGSSATLTIKNVIIDSSCSFASSYNGSSSEFDYGYVGGVIGYCYAYNGNCTIENSVNMASVAFSGNISGRGELYLGGVVGELYSSKNDSTMKNCANYGDVIYSGKSELSYIGGIA